MNESQKEQIIDKLRENGCRITRQRRILLDVILGEGCTCSKEVYYRAHKLDCTIGVATVYRMLNTLEEIGALDRQNSYQIVCDRGCDFESACTLEFDDGSTVELSARQWLEVVKKGLEEKGYCTGRNLNTFKTKTLDCLECGKFYN